MLDRIELHNFKSYKGLQTIGPFSKFTAIIGPNGSGKSNLMDAISFVFACTRADRLRGNKVQDLLHKGESHGSVCAIFKNGSGELQFERRFNNGGTEYFVGKEKVSRETYLKHLESISILPKIQNFLVFQGEVEDIAGKNPKELTKLFEKISITEEDKEKYLKAKREKELTEDKENEVYQKKKGATAERQQYKEQQEEANCWQELKQQLNSLQLEFVLFKLFYMDRKLESVTERSTLLRNQVKEQQEQVEAATAELQNKRKRHAKLTKACHLRLDEVKAKEREVNKIFPELNKCKEQLQSCEKKIEKLRNQHSKAEKVHTASSLRVQQLEADLFNVEESMRDFEQKQILTMGIHLKQEQLEEYTRLKEEATAQTLFVDSELNQKKKILESFQEDLQRERTREEEILVTIRQREATISHYEHRLVQLQEEEQKTSREWKAARDKLARVKENHSLISMKVSSLFEQERLVEADLREAKADKHESHREVQFQLALDGLMRLFPGVHGKLMDLCTPVSSKYSVALAVVFGKNMNAIVVQDLQTARACIRHLKEQRLCTATFLPLDTIEGQPISERHRAHGGTCKLVADIVTCNPAVGRAVEFVCGNILVCDSYEEAARLCFGSSERYNCVTLDGTFIKKSGLITGGVASLQGKSQQWGQKAVHELKAKRVRVHTELEELKQKITPEHEVAELEAQVELLAERLRAVQQELLLAKEKLGQLQKESQGLARHLDTLKVESLLKEVDRATHDLSLLETKKSEIVNSVFCDFCKKLNISTIREFEGTSLKEAREVNEKRLQFRTVISKLKTELEYERSRNTASVLLQLQKQMDEEENSLKFLRKNCEVLAAKQLKCRDELNAAEQHHLEAAELLKKSAAEAKAILKELAAHKAAHSALLSSLSELEREGDRINEQRSNLILDCRLNQIELPLLKNKAKGGEVCELSAVDYRGLATELKRLKAPEDVQNVRENYEKKLRAITEKIEQMTPNLKAVEKAKTAKEKVRVLDREYRQVVESAKSAKKTFEQLEKERVEKFTNVFHTVRERISEIYKSLTEIADQPGQHGIADLILEDESEPFNSGIEYSAMPPGKPYRQMELLSGGEKTVAALALLFAIHSCMPSPFFILDEIDAALDIMNVEKVANYIKLRSLDFQCVVISLKDVFYSKADTLVGVYNAGASSTLTLDLTRFDSR